MTIAPQPRYSKGLPRPVQAIVRPAQMADEKTEDAHYFEAEIVVKDANGGTGRYHAEHLTTEADPQKVARTLSDELVKRLGNARWREIDDSQ